MSEIICAGWPASWINAWLAAVGAAVLDERIRLSWTYDHEPVAVLSAEAADPAAILSESWPSNEAVLGLPIARHLQGFCELKRTVPCEVFVERARTARRHASSWALSSTLTDLAVDEGGMAQHAPFDPSVPKGLTLHDRLTTIHGHVDLCTEQLQSTLSGHANRVQANGLGFDHTRVGSLQDATDPWVDPVVEALAFFALAILPVRGQGVDGQLDRSANVRVRQNGWRRLLDSDGSLSFCWPAWRQPLDRYGIDALLDAWTPERQAAWPQFGICAAWRTVQFRPTTKRDMTRAFGSARL